MTTQAHDCDLISPTAKMVAFIRQGSDIPFAKDVAALVKADSLVRSLPMPAEHMKAIFNWMSVLLEARYKFFASALKNEHATQVLELASGFSLRGLALTSDSEITFVETDLEGVTSEKISFVEELCSKWNINPKGKLYLHAANSLSATEIEAALTHFSISQPVIVINEGFLSYLDRTEKSTVAKIVHSVLSKFGGCWITPDNMTKADFESQFPSNSPLQFVSGMLSRSTNRNFSETIFEDDQDVIQFYANLGFDVEFKNQVDGSFEFTSSQDHTPASAVEGLKRQLRYTVLRPCKNSIN